MIESNQLGSVKAILVYVNFAQSVVQPQDLEEFRSLVTSAGITIASEMCCRREAQDPKYFIGQGKVAEVHAEILQHNAEIVIFNHQLTPAQERNLERFFKCKILDRTQLILNIFAQRARSFEGKLQVELAQLEHMATRLVRGWTHLERQRGGIGLRGGPGETQLEADRRVLRQKVALLKKHLVSVEKQRGQNRRARKRAMLPTVALVGYTNAGKSTLFNQLVTGDAYVADRLFSTLDPTLRRVELANFGTVIVADTVGFIRELPHELIDAFHATLEETKEADLLLHVVDGSDPQQDEKIEIVNKVLTEIGAGAVPQLLVLNKIDLLQDFAAHVDYDLNNLPEKVWLSAANNIGMPLLIEAIQKILSPQMEEIELCLLSHATQLRAALYESNAVRSEKIDELGNFHLKLYMDPEELSRLF